MSARLLPARYVKIDGSSIDDYEDIPDGPLPVLRAVHGTGGCVLEEATYLER